MMPADGHYMSAHGYCIHCGGDGTIAHCPSPTPSPGPVIVAGEHAGACAMCRAADCTREKPLGLCPVYYGIRDVLFPGGAELTGAAALAMFQLARWVGATPLKDRLSTLADLVELLRLARIYGVMERP